MLEQNNCSKDPSNYEVYKKWLLKWLDQPIPALGGQIPNDLIKTSEGKDQVKNMLGRAIFSVYS